MQSGVDVSVVVTTRNNATTIGACLDSIRDQRDVSLELIVVDNGSTDQTPQIAAATADLVIDAGPERSAQRNEGAARSRAPHLLFIDSDMQLQPTVVAQCLSLAADGATAVTIPEESFGVGFWASCKALERSFYLGVGWMESARFFSRVTFEAVGGYDEQMTGGEDMDLPQRIAALVDGARFARCSAMIRHDEGRLTLRETVAAKFYYSKTLRLYAAKDSNTQVFGLQASPLARYRLFLTDPRALLRRPVVGLGMLFMKTAEFAAGGCGYIAGRPSRSRAGHG